MLTFMAQRLSSFFILKKIIKEEEKEIYDYCFEVLLSTVMNFISIVILALVSKTVVPTIYFLAGFIGIRITAGGYHAETHMGCFFILIGSYVMYLLLLWMMPSSLLGTFAVICCMISLLLVIIFSPVEDYNKPFTKEEYKKFKMTSNIAVTLLSSIVLIVVIFLKKETWGFSIAAGMSVVSLSLIAGTVKNKVRQH